MPYQIAAVENLTAAIQSGSLPAARAAYSRVRYPYEQMEVRSAGACDLRFVLQHQIVAAFEVWPSSTCCSQCVRMSELLPDLRHPHVQVLAPNFPQIDSDIDAREYSFDDGENSTDFKGFHRLERLLFRCVCVCYSI